MPQAQADIRLRVPHLHPAPHHQHHHSLDSQMVSGPKKRFSITEDQGPSVRRPVIRLVATYDGETHVYEFPPEESMDAAQMIALHVHEGQLHPAAGTMLCNMIMGEDDV